MADELIPDIVFPYNSIHYLFRGKMKNCCKDTNYKRLYRQRELLATPTLPYPFKS